MKKISIITTYPMVEEPVIRNRLLPFIKGFQSHGYHVSLFQPHGEKYSFDNDKVNIHFVEKQNVDKTFFISRALSEINLCIRLLLKYKKESTDNDIVLITMPSMFLIFIVGFLGAKCRIVDIRDLTWEYLSNDKLIQRFFKKTYRRLFKHVLKFSDVISVTNSDEYEYVKNIFPEDDLYLVSNGISKEQFNALIGCHQKVNIQNNILTISYIGNVGLAQDLSTLIEVARQHLDCQFNIIGGGNDLPRLKNLVASYGLSNVYFSGRVSWEKVVEYYENTDFLYAQLTDGFESAVPSKLYEYLSAGKYVIYGGGGQVQALLDSFSGVTVIPPSNKEILSDTIFKLKAQRPDLDIKHNRLLIENNFIRENAISEFIKKLGV